MVWPIWSWWINTWGLSCHINSKTVDVSTIKITRNWMVMFPMHQEKTKTINWKNATFLRRYLYLFTGGWKYIYSKIIYFYLTTICSCTGIWISSTTAALPTWRRCPPRWGTSLRSRWRRSWPGRRTRPRSSWRGASATGSGSGSWWTLASATSRINPSGRVLQCLHRCIYTESHNRYLEKIVQLNLNFRHLSAFYQ